LSTMTPDDDVSLLSWPALAPWVEVGVTGRHGGVSEGPYATLNLSLSVGDQPERVLENRRRAAQALGAELDDLVLANQVHGAEVVIVGDADRGRGAGSAGDAIGDADALVTAGTAAVLVVLAADCVPMVLCDPEAGVLAVVHAGWRGTVARVGEAALAAMSRLGAEPGRVIAGIGPAISKDRYQVGSEVAGAVEAALGPVGAIRPHGSDRWLFDLPTTNSRLLAAAGVPVAQIHACAVTTGSPGPFFSDREARPCGRFAMLARLRQEPGQG
jgi:YfiH family protein